MVYRKIHLCHEKKCKNKSRNPQKIFKKLIVTTCSVVQAKGGESGQLTCHAPVTSRSVELDFLVGTENPIRLLCREKLRR